MIIIVVLVILMMITASSSGKQNVFSSIFSLVATPVQNLSASVTGSVNDAGEGAKTPDELKAENEALKEKVRELTSSLVDYEQTMRDNQNYRDMLSIKEQNKDFEFEVASVVGRDSSDIFESFTIDIGTNKSIQRFDPVMTVDGLVGYISEVGPFSAKVITILNPNIDVSAFDRRTDDAGIVSGDATLTKLGMTKINQLSRDCAVTEGDIIVTAGIGGIFPKNLVIGEVIEVKPENQDVLLYATIKPAADIKNCQEVIVLTSFEGKGLLVDQESLEGNDEQ